MNRFFDRMDATTVLHRLWIALGALWLFVYCLFTMLLILGSGRTLASALTALIVMGVPTLIILSIVVTAVWVSKGVRREPTS